jgi:hypothetical protein
MNVDKYYQIGRTVLNNYHEFDSFIILHGTDTMAYTGINKIILISICFKFYVWKFKQNCYNNRIIGSFKYDEKWWILKFDVFFNNSWPL